MFEGLLLPWQRIYHLAFYSIFRSTPEVSSKLYFVEICYVSEKLWHFNHKELIFGLQIFDLKDHFSASLMQSVRICVICRVHKTVSVVNCIAGFSVSLPKWIEFGSYVRKLNK